MGYGPGSGMGSDPGKGKTRLATLTTILYTVVVMLVSLWAGYSMFGWARDRIAGDLPIFEDEVAVPAPGAVQTAAAAAQVAPSTALQSGAVDVAAAPVSTALNVLLMGTDERPQEGGPQRTDTIILLTLDKESQTAGMLSLPRDLWVPIPGLNETTKINTAYGLGVANNYPGGGAQQLVDTVSGFVGQPIPYYLRINFEGFTEAVDLIGGIDINVPKTIHDEKYPTPDEGYETFHLEAGLQHMDGATALKYARTRNVDDDYGRSRRQQDVIRAVVDRVRSAGMLPSLLASAPRLLSTLRNSVETNIPIDKMIELANHVTNNPPREIRQLVLDSRFGEETYSADGMWILVPDRGRVRAAVSTFFTPPALASQAPASAALPDQASVNIEVLNGTGTQGVAAKAREMLSARGWNVTSIGDADRGDYGQSILINYGVSDAVIQQISNALGIQPSLASVTGLNPDTSVDVRIVLGQDLLPILAPQP
jgi:polyisoprenyl-teichoic acid--peptidoglycan teichoic acid transferase